METGGRAEFGVYAAVEVHYLSTGGARAAAVLAADVAFAHMLADRTAVVPPVPPCRPGEFYRRELPPLRRGPGRSEQDGACWRPAATPTWTLAAGPAWVRTCTPSPASR
jgi:hypothetical protein